MAVVVGPTGPAGPPPPAFASAFIGFVLPGADPGRHLTISGSDGGYEILNMVPAARSFGTTNPLWFSALPPGDPNYGLMQIETAAASGPTSGSASVLLQASVVNYASMTRPQQIAEIGMAVRPVSGGVGSSIPLTSSVIPITMVPTSGDNATGPILNYSFSFEINLSPPQTEPLLIFPYLRFTDPPYPVDMAVTLFATNISLTRLM